MMPDRPAALADLIARMMLDLIRLRTLATHPAKAELAIIAASAVYALYEAALKAQERAL